ncbi:MAG: fibronectin type III domain-containing protein, partial [Nitrospirota bacterium]
MTQQCIAKMARSASRLGWFSFFVHTLFVLAPISASAQTPTTCLPRAATGWDFQLVDLTFSGPGFGVSAKDPFITTTTLVKGTSVTVMAVVTNCGSLQGPNTPAEARLTIYIIPAQYGQDLTKAVAQPTEKASTAIELFGTQVIQTSFIVPSNIPNPPGFIEIPDGPYTIMGRISTGSAEDTVMVNNDLWIPAALTTACPVQSYAVTAGVTAQNTADPCAPPDDGPPVTTIPLDVSGIPEAPTPPRLTVVSPTRIDGQWSWSGYKTLSDCVAGWMLTEIPTFIVQRWPTNTPGTVTSYSRLSATLSDTNLASNTSYSYRVRAHYKATHAVAVIKWTDGRAQPCEITAADATIEDGYTAWSSPISTATTATANVLPTTPSNPSPGNLQRGVVLPLTLQWQASDPDSTASLKYRLFLDTDKQRVFKASFGVRIFDDSAITHSASGGSIYVVGGMNYCSTYYWKVEVTDGQGGKRTSDVWEFSTHCAPTAAIHADETFGRYPLTVDVTAQAQADPAATIVSYLWKFCNLGYTDPNTCPGDTASTPSATHTYPDPGTYIVALRVIDSKNFTNNWTTLPINVTVNVGDEFLIASGTVYEMTPAVAYNSRRDQYLIAWAEGTSLYQNNDVRDVYGVILNSAGQVVQSRFPIAVRTGSTQMQPAVAYDDVNDRFLAVWTDSRRGLTEDGTPTGNRNYDIYGQLVYPTGGLLGSALLLAAGESGSGDYRGISMQNPRVVFGKSGGTAGFLLSWVKATRVFPADATITDMLAILSPFGAVVNTMTALVSQKIHVDLPALGFDGTRFLTARTVKLANTCTGTQYVYCDYQLQGQFVDFAGNLGSPFAITTRSQLLSVEAANNPALVFNPVQQQYLAVWGMRFIKGALIGTDGSIQTPAFSISTSTNAQRAAATFDGLHYLVVWMDNDTTDGSQLKVRGARLRADGTVLDPAGIPVSSTQYLDYQGSAAIAGGSGTFNMLVAWADKGASSGPTVNPNIYAVFTHAATPVTQVLIPPVPPPSQPVPGVDLVVGALSIGPAILKSGAPLSIEPTLRNDGVASSGPFSVRYDWSSVYPAPANSQLYSQAMPGLTAGGSMLSPFSVTPPNGVDGNYFITIQVDPGDPDQVAESNEFNNTAAVAITIDNTPPTISFGSPLNGAAVGGTAVPVFVQANDEVGVARVDIYLDGLLASNLGIAADDWGWNWDTTQIAAGSHTLTAKAYDLAGNMAASAPVTVQVDNTPPVISGVTVSNQTAGSATISWTTNEASDTQVEYGTTASYGNGSTLNAAMVTSHSVMLSGLSASTTYNYRVRSRDAARNLAMSGNLTFSTLAAADTTPPGTPASLTAAWASGTQINLSWPAVTDTGGSGLASYRIERCSGSTTCTPAEITSVAGTVTSYSNTGLTTTIYRYRVRARDGAGNNGGYSPIVTVNPDTTAPGTPGSLTATVASSSQINLSWPAVTDTGGTGLASYRIERCSGSTTCTTFAEIASVASATTAYNNTGLTAGTIYRYRVRARDGAGNNGGYSPIATITLDTTAPGTPSSLTAAWVGGTQINLSWAAVTDTGGSGLASYRIERCSGSTTCTTFAEIASVAGSTTSYSNTGLTTTIYRYRVRARDGAGNNGGYSPIATVNPDTTAP